jgi:hypothetical protein
MASQGNSLPVSGASLEAGRTYSAWFPFKREKYQPHPEHEGDGEYSHPPERDTWVPGWSTEVGGCEGEHITYGWHGDGAMLLTVVSLHKPGPTYPERAFYVRQWRDPDGREFGRANLRCISSRALKSWLAGRKMAFLFDDPGAALENSRALFFEAIALAAADATDPISRSGRTNSSNGKDSLGGEG